MHSCCWLDDRRGILVGAIVVSINMLRHLTNCHIIIIIIIIIQPVKKPAAALWRDSALRPGVTYHIAGLAWSNFVKQTKTNMLCVGDIFVDFVMLKVCNDAPTSHN